MASRSARLLKKSSEWALTLYRVSWILNNFRILRSVCQIGQALNLKDLEEWGERDWSLLNLEIIDCESVKISTRELRGSVDIADTIATSLALYEEGQLEIWAEKLWITCLLSTWAQLMPIEQWLVPSCLTELSV